jgi:hypothetical protein
MLKTIEEIIIIEQKHNLRAMFVQINKIHPGKKFEVYFIDCY